MDPLPLAIGCACACAVWLVWVRRWERRGRYRKGEEHGSARWATAKEIEAYSDRKDADNNIILTDNARIRLVSRRFDLSTDTNDNVLVVGGPGTGKTRYYVKPNLLQANASFFVTDPKGTLIREMGGALAELQALEFVLVELGLYLDTHQGDAEAFELYKQYAAMEKEAREKYEAMNGPVTQMATANAKTWAAWLSEPWPWNYQEGGMK
mgnify:CR=1 FL=1